MSNNTNPIVAKYSELAGEYDDDLNIHSCWGRATEKILGFITLKKEYSLVLDVGCGTGRALLHLASRSKPNIQFIGIDPAANMQKRAAALTQEFSNVKILDGCFETMPIESGTVDYLYSILAFHWTTDLEQSVSEIARVLKPAGEMDLFFIGRKNGQEFIQKTTPIFLKYMGPALLLESAGMRKQLTKEAAIELFTKKFSRSRLAVEESFETYYDTLEGHWSWWVRIEGHFIQMPPQKKKECDREVKQAISTLATDKGIPYTIHLLHVKLRQE
jgi:ubiquinone/menaquinone biosynthesis C-methylase UbiE